MADEKPKPGAAAAPDSNRCPNDGGEFVNVVVQPIDKDNPRQAQLTASRDKLTKARGALQRCASCGYQRRANDLIEPATKAA